MPAPEFQGGFNLHRSCLPLAALLAANAFASIDASRFRGALTQDAPAPAQAQSPGLSPSPVEQATREQLTLERQRLESQRPGIGGPVALTAVGGGLVVAGLVVVLDAAALFIYAGTKGTLALLGYALLGVAGALWVAAAVLLPLGLTRLFARLGERRALSQRLDELDARQRALDEQSPAPEAPAPDAGLFEVKARYVVATF